MITGANIGLGFESALQLYLKGSTLILGCRSLEKCEEAASKIKQTFTETHRFTGENKLPKIATIGVKLDDLGSVRQFTLAIQRHSGDRLDRLIFNAGFANDKGEIEYSAQGFETTFAVNHLAHFMMFRDLRAIIEATAKHSNVTIVTVSSAANFFPKKGIKLTKQELNDPKSFSMFPTYGESKLCNILFAKEISDQMEGLNVYSNSLHPGLVATNMGKFVLKDCHCLYLGYLVLH